MRAALTVCRYVFLFAGAGRVKEEPPELPEGASENLVALLTAMLAKNPEERPTVAALRQHP